MLHCFVNLLENRKPYSYYFQKRSLFPTSIMDRQLLRQNGCPKITVIKTNTYDDITKIVHFGIFIHVLS